MKERQLIEDKPTWIKNDTVKTSLGYQFVQFSQPNSTFPTKFFVTVFSMKGDNISHFTNVSEAMK